MGWGCMSTSNLRQARADGLGCIPQSLNPKLGFRVKTCLRERVTGLGLLGMVWGFGVVELFVGGLVAWMKLKGCLVYWSVENW